MAFSLLEKLQVLVSLALQSLVPDLNVGLSKSFTMIRTKYFKAGLCPQSWQNHSHHSPRPRDLETLASLDMLLMLFGRCHHPEEVPARASVLFMQIPMASTNENKVFVNSLSWLLYGRVEPTILSHM